MPTKDGRMQAREFLFYVEDLVMASLADDVPRPQRKVMWTILQLSWDNPAAHIELQPQPSRSVIELGLHFEASAEENEAWSQRLIERADDIHVTLPEWEFEEWTASWRRLHRTYALERLTGELGREVAAEMAKAVAFLWPFAMVGAPSPKAASPSRPVHNRHRAHARR